MKFMRSKILLGIAASALAFSAHAKTEAITFDQLGNADFGNFFTRVGAFTDTFTFDLLANADAAGMATSVVTLNAKKIITKDLDITRFDLSGPNGFAGAGEQQSSGLFEAWTLNASNISSGSYTLTVGGIVNKVPTGGNVTYEGSIAISPVPEPATWGMLISGLGLVGFMAYRRKINDSTSQFTFGALPASA